MASVETLMARIDAQFNASQEKLKAFREEQSQQLIERDKRLEQFAVTLDKLTPTWRPRLEALLKKFGDRAKASPTMTPSRRSVLLKMDNELARVELRVSAFADQEARNAVFNYDLNIVPILMKFDAHSEISFPIDKIDEDKLTQWLDDCLVKFVQTYLSIFENAHYLKGHMVEDPVAKVHFPKFAAGCTLEQGGKTLYFLNENTRDEYRKRAEH